MNTCLSNCICLGFAMYSYGGAFAWKQLPVFMNTAHCQACIQMRFNIPERHLSLFQSHLYIPREKQIHHVH